MPFLLLRRVEVVEGALETSARTWRRAVACFDRGFRLIASALKKISGSERQGPAFCFQHAFVLRAEDYECVCICVIVQERQSIVSDKFGDGNAHFFVLRFIRHSPFFVMIS